MSMKRVTIYVLAVLAARAGLAQDAPNIALINGRWFNGRSFETGTKYSVHGVLSINKPRQVNQTLDLAGSWIVPPFAEAHNHNIGTGVEADEMRAVQKYLTDGVFYVKIQGNLPISDDGKQRLSLNRPGGLDVVFAQGSLTATGGHPILLSEMLLSQGNYPGLSKQDLKDNRYFTIDSEADLERKWPLIAAKHPDFIKTFLWYSDQFEKRKDDPAYLGQKGLDPRLLPKIAAKAHANSLRVSTHVTTAADFHNALVAGVDEITHLPFLGSDLISKDDANLAARRGTTLITTASLIRTLPRMILPENSVPGIRKTQVANVKLLSKSGALLVVGSDNVRDSSAKEFDYLSELNVLDNLTLLNMWTSSTAKAIFPNRKIGNLNEGSEASFLALEGNPVEDLQNVHRIRVRFKQGLLLEK
jgi:hypothetical protein